MSPNELFEFVTEGHTRWRYEFAASPDGTVVTESFSHPPHVGWQRWIYARLANRRRAMTVGMERTLDRVKQVVEVGVSGSD